MIHSKSSGLFSGFARLSGAAVLLLAASFSAFAQSPELRQTLTAFDVTPQPRFGQQLRADGSTLVVGARNAAYVYELSASGDFQFQQKLWPGSFQNGFPRHTDVELDGDRILLTQPSLGEVWLYERAAGTWSPSGILRDPEPSTSGADPGFGATLALEGTRFVVADLWRAPGTPLEGSSRQGRVWFGDLSLGSALTEVVPSVRGAEDGFGDSMSLRGNLLAVGAPGAQGNAPTYRGRVHLFEQNSSGQWHEIQRIEPTLSSSVLGLGVALEANRLSVLDIASSNDVGFIRGGASIYGRSLAQPSEPWNLIERVRPIAMNSCRSFHVDGDRMIFRRPEAFGTPTQIAEAHAVQGEWSTESVTVDSGLNQHTSSRLPVLYFGDYLIAGADEAVHVYEVRPRQVSRYCSGVNSCQGCRCPTFAKIVGGCQNSQGRLATMTTEGFPRLQGDSLRVGAEGLNSNTLAVLFAGTSRLPQSTLGCDVDGEARPFGVRFTGSNGLRCVGGLLRRLGARQADESGTIDRALQGWGATGGGSIAMDVGAAAGQTWNLQVYYRDSPYSTCTGTINTTDAVSLTYVP